MGIFTADELAAYKAQKIQPAAVPTQQKKTGRGGFATSLISEGLGTLGAVGGTLLLPGVGTAAGAALGSGLGNALEQKVRNEDTGVKWSSALGEGALSGLFAGAPIGKIAKGVVSPLKTAGKIATTKIGKDVAEQSVESDVKNTVSKIGSNLRQTVANPKVTPSVGGAQKEAEIASRVGAVPGLSARAKYNNLQGEVEKINTKIAPILKQSKDTVGSEDLLAGIRKNAEQSSHFLAGDDSYEKQLSSVMADLSAKTGGAKKLTAQQMFDYKKGMDMNSVFTKVSKGADLNPKEAARLAVWSSLDDGITKAAPGVKTLTKEQSLLIQAAPGLKTASTKTAGIPLLGVKSQSAERGMQAGREVIGKTLEKVGGSGVVPQLGAKTAPSVGGLVARTAGADVMSPNLETPPPVEADVPLDAGATDAAPDATPQVDPTDIYDPANVLAAIQSIKDQGGDEKDIASYLANFKTMQEVKQLSGGSAVKKTESQRARDEASQLTDTAIQKLSAGSVRTGLLGTKVENVKRLFGNADPETLDFNVTIDSLKAAIAKARAGTSFTPNEEALLNKYAPTSGDTGQVLKTKLLALKDVYQQAEDREAGTQYQADGLTGTGL